jgi:hypothetical protein
MTVRGLEHLKSAIGRELTRSHRYVLGLGRSNDPFGHGITEFDFDGVELVVRPGPNEDYLVVESGPLDARGLDEEYWTEVDLTGDHKWQPRGRLAHVEVFTDGTEDVALLFVLDSGDRFSVVLCDTDVAIGRGLEPFRNDPNHAEPRFRTQVG